MSKAFEVLISSSHHEADKYLVHSRYIGFKISNFTLRQQVYLHIVVEDIRLLREGL
uniref:Uncharacterized protein n=1 Tax=Lepeophtheirus salmonis TaxID=72036 RepID=A0A0K2UAX6_LEPSM